MNMPGETVHQGMNPTGPLGWISGYTHGRCLERSFWEV